MAELLDASWLASAQGQSCIDEASQIADALTAITRLRKSHSTTEPNRITQAVSQSVLRKKLEDRWNISGADFLLTEDGLEQASRPLVSRYRAQWIKDHFGANAHVLDMTCGLGFDALAMAQAGLRVTCVERDGTIAALAGFNLRNTSAHVVNADATDFLIDSGVDVVFVDPARRDPQAGRKSDGSSYRIFNPDDWSPSWSFIQTLSQRVPVMAKVAPGIGDDSLGSWDCQWISADGDLVEALATSDGPGRRSDTGRRSATLLSSSAPEPLLIPGSHSTSPSQLGQWLVIPDAALIRASALDFLADRINGGLVNEHIAWLTSADGTAVQSLIGLDPAPATLLRIEVVLPVNEKLIAREVARHETSGLTVMTRGVTVNVDALRKKVFKKKTPGAAELVLAIYRDDPNNVALLCRRITAQQPE
jgi:THUMP domain-like